MVRDFKYPAPFCARKRAIKTHTAISLLENLDGWKRWLKDEGFPCQQRPIFSMGYGGCVSFREGNQLESSKKTLHPWSLTIRTWNYLVVLTQLKNMSQNGSFPEIGVK